MEKQEHSEVVEKVVQVTQVVEEAIDVAEVVAVQ